MTDQQMLSEARDWLVSIMNITPTEESAEHHAKRSNQLKWLIDKVEQQQQEIERLKRFYDYFEELYGEGLEIANWHQNGDLEAFDNFFESAEEHMKGESK